MWRGYNCVMINESGIVDKIWNGHWAECASTASFYEYRSINKATQQSPLQLMYNTLVKGFNNLFEPLVRCVSWQPRKPFKENKMIEELLLYFLVILKTMETLYTGYFTWNPSKSSSLITIHQNALNCSWKSLLMNVDCAFISNF